MFDIPTHDKIKEVIITKEAVEGEAAPKVVYEEEKKAG